MSDIRFPVEAGHILTFARAVGDANQVYAEEAAAKEAGFDAQVAPPTFVQSVAQYDPNYPLRPRIGEVWFGSGRSPSGLMDQEADGKDGGGGSGGGGGNAGTLHAEQHYEYHKPLTAGTVLTATTKPGESWEKEGRRGGKLHFSESITEYRDQHGDLVVTARSVGVRTERVIDSDGS